MHANYKVNCLFKAGPIYNILSLLRARLTLILIIPQFPRLPLFALPLLHPLYLLSSLSFIFSFFYPFLFAFVSFILSFLPFLLLSFPYFTLPIYSRLHFTHPLFTHPVSPYPCLPEIKQNIIPKWSWNQFVIL